MYATGREGYAAGRAIFNWGNQPGSEKVVPKENGAAGIPVPTDGIRSRNRIPPDADVPA